MKYSVASVPFLNAKPLVWALEQEPERFDVTVAYELPARLPALLDSGAVDAVLVSSIDALTVPGRRIAEGCSISSFGRVMSVRLFSRVPLDRVETLALDSSSLSSNALAQIVLRELYGSMPTCTREAPIGQAMLAEHDACVLIGDRGLVFDGSGLFELDLGEAWTHLTNLPFVWACWVGGERLVPALVARLEEARRVGESNLASIAQSAPAEVSAQLAHRYLTEAFDYRLTDAHLSSLAWFGSLVVEHGLADRSYTPTVVVGAMTDGVPRSRRVPARSGNIVPRVGM